MGLKKSGKFGGGIGFLALTAFVALVIIFNSASVEAGLMCNDNQIILKLSSATNAHGEVWNGAGNYVTEVCYDRVFGQTYDTTTYSNFRECLNNKVIGLSSSSTTNAHAEAPTQSNYANSVCYGDLRCTVETGSCPSGSRLVVSLSGTTNAHLANTSTTGYVNICCTSAGGPPESGPNITDAWWEDAESGLRITYTNSSYMVTMAAQTANMSQGTVVQFSVERQERNSGLLGCTNGGWVTNVVSSSSVIDSQGVARNNILLQNFIDTECGDYQNFRFTATASGVSKQSYVIRADIGGGFVIDPQYCWDYPTETECDAYTPAVAVRSVAVINSSVNCDASNVNCFCEWIVESQDLENRCAAGWEINTGVPGTGSTIGRCIYTPTTTDNCDDGLLNLTWTGTYVWNSSNSYNSSNGGCAHLGTDYIYDPVAGVCRYDPNRESLQCNSGWRIVECPAQIALPFFNIYNIIAIIVIIGVVYLIIHSRKKGKHGHKNK